jgi:glycosyltransferase involved in cell wall biosynthesis
MRDAAYDVAVSRPFHVGVNALFLDPGVSGGPETYLRGLLPAIARAHPRLELTIVTTRRGARALRADGWADFARVLHLPFDEGQRERRLLAEQVALVALARRRRFDVLHSLASTAPVRPLTRSVVTLHDVTFFRMRTFGLVTTLGMKAVVRGAAHSATALIAGSAAARDDIVAQLGIDPARFTVVPHGAGRPSGDAVEGGPEVRAALGLNGRRIVLSVGAVRPHKNQGLLVEAVPHLPEDVALVVAGRRERGADDLERRSRELGVADRVVVAGYLDDARLEGLWKEAACATFPTRAEGFGLPVVEAMQRGVPVACSDIPVLREVGGSAVRYFGPDDAAGAASAVLEAMADPSAAKRGRERARGFTWERAAEGTYGVYERALA